ncbi:MAG: hypothetical protein RLZZ437_1279 [Pseudomonadota bacterium]
MTQFYNGADSINISWNLILLSLDAMIPAYELVKAPALSEPERASLRQWILQGPPLDCFAFGNNSRSFAEYACVLEGLLPHGRGTALLNWGVFTSSLVDPSPGQAQKDWPSNACDEWLTAFDEAQECGALDYLSIGPEARDSLLKIIADRQTRRATADKFTLALKKEWDPYPLDPAQLAYNRKVKSAWDAKLYDEFCRENSASLDFAIIFMVDHQEAHGFVRKYASQLSSIEHQIICRELPKLLEGRGRYQIQPWQLERLLEYADRPLESLLPFSQAPAQA